MNSAIVKKSCRNSNMLPNALTFLSAQKAQSGNFRKGTSAQKVDKNDPGRGWSGAYNGCNRQLLNEWKKRANSGRNPAKMTSERNTFGFRKCSPGTVMCKKRQRCEMKEAVV